MVQRFFFSCFCRSERCKKKKKETFHLLVFRLICFHYTNRMFSLSLLALSLKIEVGLILRLAVRERRDNDLLWKSGFLDVMVHTHTLTHAGNTNTQWASIQLSSGKSSAVVVEYTLIYLDCSHKRRFVWNEPFYSLLIPGFEIMNGQGSKGAWLQDWTLTKLH